MTEHCGTDKGYRLHLTRGEPTCRPCKDARNARHRRYVGRTEPRITAAERIAEIERLLSYGEGEYAIIRAAGYQGREYSLKRLLYRNGRADLNERIFYMGEVAA